MSTALPGPGDQLGSFQLLREIGRGAMGVVYEAAPVAATARVPAGRRIALKLLVFPPLLPEGERAALILRFAREARALAAIRHPNVVEVFEVGEAEGQPYLAMEYLAGINAREWLLRHGPMRPEALTSLGRQLCDALAAVHAAGIIHRDIKPDNVVLEADGTIRLTDFGIARMEVEASLTRTGGLIGSPAYMAPEQILGGSVDARADLFSAGVTLYQLLTGELPFQGTGIMEVAHRVAYEPPQPLTGIPPGLASVLLRALEKVPDHRFPDAAAMSAALTECLTSVQEEAGVAPYSAVPPPSVPAPALSTPLSSTRLIPAALPDPCSFHPGRAAVAHCTECDQPLCHRCARYQRGQAWCSEHAIIRGRPAWLTRLEVLGIGLLFALLLWSLYPIHW